MRRVAIAITALAAVLLPGSPAVAATTSPFEGLGTWVDIYDAGYKDNPERVVAEAVANGVATIYAETGNSSQAVDVMRRESLVRLIRLAHAEGIAVVFWYLPELQNMARDRRRLLAMARVGAPGLKPDGVAIDIESSAVRNVEVRSRRTVQLTAELRRADPEMPLAAIIPSPPGIERLGERYWPRFPYARLARQVDAFLPMCYASYRPEFDTAAIREYGAACVTGVTAGVGREVPVHVIGGVTYELSNARTRALVEGATEAGAIGFGMYGLRGMRWPQWDAMHDAGW